MTRSKWAGIIAVLVLAAAAGWYFASPWYTLRQMKAAAQAGDSATFASYVDFPALREDLKAEMMAKILAESKKDTSGFGKLGIAIGSAVIGPMVDGMVSPAGLRAAFIANREEADQRLAAAPAGMHVADQPVLHRRGFSEFLVASNEHPKAGLVFTRHALGWKLSGIDLPADSPVTR